MTAATVAKAIRTKTDTWRSTVSRGTGKSDYPQNSDLYTHDHPYQPRNVTAAQIRRCAVARQWRHRHS